MNRRLFAGQDAFIIITSKLQSLMRQDEFEDIIRSFISVSKRNSIISVATLHCELSTSSRFEPEAEVTSLEITLLEKGFSF